MPPWVYALIAALGAAGVVGVKVGTWWRGRLAARREQELHERLAAAELSRDVVRGEVEVARADVASLVNHTERQEAAVMVAEEIRHAAPASLDPDDRRAALRASVRAHARGAGPVPGDSEAAPVRAPAATGTGGNDDGRGGG